MNRHVVLIGVAALAAPLADARAQQGAGASAAGGGLEEVVVTAQRRTENLQRVPVTVTAVSPEQLLASGITNVQQLSNLVPSLTVIDPTGYTMAFIRGVGSSTLGSGTFSSTAIYIDNVYIARTTNGMFELDAVDGVQVLAGPQGALYGRNATAGAIVITTDRPEPGADPGGTLSMTAGNYDHTSFSGKFSTGLGENFALSVTAAKHDRAGFVTNLNPATSINTENMEDRDSLSASVALAWVPSDRTAWHLRVAYAESNDRASGGYEPVGLSQPGPFPGLNDNQSAIFGGVAQVYAPVFGASTPAIAFQAARNAVFSSEFGASYDPHRDGFTNGLLEGEHLSGSALFISNLLATLNGSIEFDGFTLRSITGYTDSDYHGAVGVSVERQGSATSPLAPFPLNAQGGLGFSSINPSEVFSQGFQFLSPDDARYQWIAGVDYSKEDGYSVLTGDFFGASLYSADNDWTVTSMAGYAQVTVPFAERWAATLGGRYTSEEYEIVDQFPTGAPNALPGVPRLAPFSEDSNKFTYTARLEYQAEDFLLFGGVATGFKSATLNPNSPAQGRADPEEVTSFEVGLKKDFGDRYRVNASAYYATYENIQLNVIDQGTGANILTNGPESEVMGLDVQAIAQLTPNFRLSGSATLLNAEFTENGPGLPIDGNKLPGAADFAASVVADYGYPLANGGSIELSGTLVYNSGVYYEHLNLVGSGGDDDDSYSVLNLSLGYRAPDNRWSATLWGRNVLDEEYYRSGIVAFGSFGRLGLMGYPQQWGGTVTFNF